MVKERTVSTSTILKAVVVLSDTVTSLIGTVAELPTKNDVERIVERQITEAFKTNEQLKKIDELVKEVKAISKAVDKDAETIVKHDRRITRMESHLSLK